MRLDRGKCTTLLEYQMRLGYLRIGIVLILYVVSAGAIASVNPVAPNLPSVEVNDSFSSAKLNKYLLYCLTGKPPAKGADDCKPLTGLDTNPAQHLEHSEAPRYSLLTLRNNAATHRVLVLEHQLAITDRVTLENLDHPEETLREAGAAVPLARRDYRSAFPAFRLDLRSGETVTYRIGVTAQMTTMPAFFLFSEAAYFQHNQKNDMIQALFYGLIVCLVLYNLLLYVRLRLQVYLLYVLFLSSVAVIYLQIYGHGFLFLWPDDFWIQQYIREITKFLAALFVIAFFSDLLSVREKIPRLYNVIRWTYPVFLLGPFSGLFLSPMAYFGVANMAILLGVLYTLFVSILSVLGKLPFSSYYIIAMISMLGSVLTNLLASYGLLPANVLTIYSMQAGTALEAIFLSLALGDRFANIEKENIRLQQLRIEDKKRIAKDIHDVVGTEFQMRLVEIKAEGESLVGAKLAEGLRGTLNKIREFLFLLHTEEDLPSNLVSNIRALLRRLEATKKFKVQSLINFYPTNLRPAGVYHLERAADEIIANIARHAQADKVVFILRAKRKYGLLVVHDNGVGFDYKTVRHNIGLESLQYRAQRLSGRLRIFSRDTKGCAVALRFPLEHRLA